jgi:hypothetical protein
MFAPLLMVIELAANTPPIDDVRAIPAISKIAPFFFFFFAGSDEPENAPERGDFDICFSFSSYLLGHLTVSDAVTSKH